MVDIIKGFIDLVASFINWLFNLEIEFIGTSKVPLGIVVISFVFLIFCLYLILKAFGFYDSEE